MKPNETEEASERLKIKATPQEIDIWNEMNDKSYEELLQWIRDNSIETAMIEIKNVEKR